MRRPMHREGIGLFLIRSVFHVLSELAQNLLQTSGDLDGKCNERDERFHAD